MTRPVDVASLVDAHHAALWRYLRYLGADRSLADDLVQETFVQLMQDQPQQRSPRETAGWLRTVARNRFLMQLRRERRQVPFDLDAADAAWEASDADHTEVRHAALRECLQTLQGKAREVVMLRYEQQLSGEEIAKRLGISHANVRVLLHRVRESLRQCVEKRLS